MTDNELIAALITTLTPPMVALYPTLVILQKNQPTQQGVPSAPTLYIEKLFDKRYGFTRTDYDLTPVTDPTTPIPKTNFQLVETTIQFSALVIQNPSDLTIPTASDVVNTLAMILSDSDILSALRTLGANTERSIQVGNTYFQDDRDRFEAHPSFDIVFQHQREYSTTTPALQFVDVQIYPV